MSDSPNNIKGCGFSDITVPARTIDSENAEMCIDLPENRFEAFEYGAVETERGVIVPGIFVEGADAILEEHGMCRVAEDVPEMFTPALIEIDEKTLAEITKGLSKEKVTRILTDLHKRSGKYHQEAVKATKKVAESFTWKNMGAYVRSKGKDLLVDRQRALENSMVRGVPLFATIASLFLLSDLADLAGIENQAVRFAFIVKTAGWASVPVRVTLEQIYTRKSLKVPVDQMTRASFNLGSSGRAINPGRAAAVMADLPIKNMSWLEKVGRAYGHDFPLNGRLLSRAGWDEATGLITRAKILSRAGWKVGANFLASLAEMPLHMGDGLIFSNVADYLAGDLIEENVGSWLGSEKGKFARELTHMLFFFGEEIGNVGLAYFTGAGEVAFSRVLNSAPLFWFRPLGQMAGIFFFTELVDFGLLAAWHGNDKANYIHSISFRAMEKYHSPADSFIDFFFGKSARAQTVSGRMFGAPVDLIQSLRVGLGIMDERRTCSYLRRQEWERDNAEVAEDIIPMIKAQLTDALVNEIPAGSKDLIEQEDAGKSDPVRNSLMKAMVGGVCIDHDQKGRPAFLGVSGARTSQDAVTIWRERIKEGYFAGINRERWDKGGVSLLNPAIVDHVKLATSIHVPASDVIRRIFSEDMLDVGRLFKWLGGQEALLSRRRRGFIKELMEADIRRVSQKAVKEDLDILKLGIEAGFIKKAEKGINLDNDYYDVYDFVHDKDYYKTLARYVPNVYSDGNADLRKNLMKYTEYKGQAFIAAKVRADADAADHFRDLKILHPAIVFSKDRAKQSLYQAFLKLYHAAVPEDNAFSSAVTAVGTELEESVKSFLARGAAARKILGINSDVDHCYPLYQGYNRSGQTMAITPESMNEIGRCIYGETIHRGLVHYAEGAGSEDCTMQNLGPIFKVIHSYQYEGDGPSWLVDTGALTSDGTFVNPDAVIAWLKDDVEKVEGEITGRFVQSKYQKGKWVADLTALVDSQLVFLRERLAKQWIVSVIGAAFERKETPMNYFQKSLDEPVNIKVHSTLKNVAAVYKVMKNGREKTARFDSFWRAINTGAITEKGALGDKRALDIWMSSQAIKIAREKIEFLKQKVAWYEEGIARLEAGKSELISNYNEELQHVRHGKKISDRMKGMGQALKMIEERLAEFNQGNKSLDQVLKTLEKEIVRLKTLRAQKSSLPVYQEEVFCNQ